MVHRVFSNDGPTNTDREVKMGRLPLLFYKAADVIRKHDGCGSRARRVLHFAGAAATMLRCEIHSSVLDFIFLGRPSDRLKSQVQDPVSRR